MTLYIESGSSWKNSYNENFNSKFSDVILNCEIFETLFEAKVALTLRVVEGVGAGQEI